MEGFEGTSGEMKTKAQRPLSQSPIVLSFFRTTTTNGKERNLSIKNGKEKSTLKKAQFCPTNPEYLTLRGW